MTTTELIPHVEALIFASDKPLTTLEIVELVNNAFPDLDEKINLDMVEAVLEGITEKYRADFYPFEMKMSGGGWQATKGVRKAQWSLLRASLDSRLTPYPIPLIRLRS